MRPSKITTLLVDMIIKAHTGGLSRSEIATATRISERTLYQWLSERLDPLMSVTAYGQAADLRLPEHTEFNVCSGIQEKIRLFEGLCSISEKTPEVQMQEMTGTELSTTIRYGLNPYPCSQARSRVWDHRPAEEPFNDIVNWRYTHLPEMLGAGCAFSWIQNHKAI